MYATYEQFQKMHIDFSAIGMEQCDAYVPYYCTPKNARIIGSAGVDGIHYCTISEFGETIFAVSPMNFGDCVHPIAQNFEDLLRLLLYCADMAALEQCYAWNEEQFKTFLLDCPPTEKQQAVLDAIRKEFNLEPMYDAFSYIKKLQSEFDLSQIPYTEDYYDKDMNPSAPVQHKEWKVSYEGGFWSNDGKAGIEVTIGKTFCWGKEKWYIPAVYICDEGLVIDYFMKVDPFAVKTFIDKWDLYHECRNRYTREQREQIEREHPLDVRFDGHVTLNKKKLRSDHGCRLAWLTDYCLPQGSRHEVETKRILEHYDMDLNRAWAIHRWSYKWSDAETFDIHSLTIRMERQKEDISGQHFVIPNTTKDISIAHPVTGQIYTLTVHEVEQQKLPENAFCDPSMEYPNHFLTMSYSLKPDIHEQGFMVQDCTEGDSPRRKKCDPNFPEPVVASSVGIIGGADGPTAIIMGQNTPKLHVACSSLHFEPVDKVEWRAVFSEKTMDDTIVHLV